MPKLKVPEEIRPRHEAWLELRAEYSNFEIASASGRSQAAGAQAVQAMTECTRRLREIIAEFYPEPDDDDDDEAV